MAGYSATLLPRKLGIKPGHRVAVLNAEAGFKSELAPLPDEVTLHERLSGREPLDVIILFAPQSRALARQLGPAARRLRENGGLWIAWPKKASGRVTDLTETEVRDSGLALGLVDNKVCAVNDVWSGLRFVVPLAKRKSAPRR